MTDLAVIIFLIVLKIFTRKQICPRLERTIRSSHSEIFDLRA